MVKLTWYKRHQDQGNTREFKKEAEEASTGQHRGATKSKKLLSLRHIRRNKARRRTTTRIKTRTVTTTYGRIACDKNNNNDTIWELLAALVVSSDKTDASFREQHHARVELSKIAFYSMYPITRVFVSYRVFCAIVIEHSLLWKMDGD